MMIETINATLFSVFLFIFFLSTACCFLYNPAAAGTNCNYPSAVYAPSSSNSELSTLVNTPSEVWNEVFEPPSVQVEKFSTQEQPEVEPQQFVFEKVAINTQLITLRQARAIASAIKKANPSLGIQQKVNGSNARVEWLRVQIKNRLEQAPQVIIPIIRELAPAASGVQRK